MPAPGNIQTTDGGCLPVNVSVITRAGVSRIQRVDGVGGVTRHHDASVGQRLTPLEQRVRHICQRRAGVATEVRRQPVRRRLEGGRRAGRQHEHVMTPGGRRWRRVRRLLHEQVQVRPPSPSAMTPAMRRRPGGTVQSRNGRIDVEGTVPEVRLRMSDVSKCRVAGISRCCSARTTLMRPTMPAASPAWPMLPLTDPTAQNCLCAVKARNAFVSATISIASPLA